MTKIGRNDPCPCGSGRKYKQCCLGKPPSAEQAKAATTLAQLLQAAQAHAYAGRLEQAEQAYRQVVQAQPNHADALHMLGAITAQLGRDDIAIEFIDRTLALDPSNPFALSNRGILLQRQGRLDEALACFRDAVARKPDYVDAHFNLGVAFQDQGELDEAIACYRKVLALKPDHVASHNNLGVTLEKRGRLDEAMACYRNATALKPDFAEAHNNLGVALEKQDKLDEALACYRRALAIRPGYVEAHNGMGFVFEKQGRLDEAMACYRHALALDPGYDTARMNLLHQQQHACVWEHLEADALTMRRAVRERPAGRFRIAPMSFVALPGTTAEEQRLCAESWAKNVYGPLASLRRKLAFAFARMPSAKINVGYISGDFREHPVSQLMAEVFELHDRKNFRITAYSYGPDDCSPMRERVKTAFDEFADLRTLSDEAAARRIFADRIDVLVDLTGYTLNTRTSILALRPAPIQVSYLGYLGTTGADFMDYLVADPFLVPPEQAGHYSEKIAYLPSYQANDRRCAIAAAPTRAACGLPEDAIVFCCFNQTYKISPEVFDVWMRLLKSLPGSVFWLFASNPYALGNLRREAQARGISPERLVFAERVPLDQHLARLRCADLFLDTASYNAGATASNALWSGLPVITCAGQTFSSRMAGSLLTALGMPELITYSLDDYFSLALDLARDQTRLAGIRAKIVANRQTAPLFDSEKFTRSLEQLYREMLEADRPAK